MKTEPGYKKSRSWNLYFLLDMVILKRLLGISQDSFGNYSYVWMLIANIPEGILNKIIDDMIKYLIDLLLVSRIN